MTRVTMKKNILIALLLTIFFTKPVIAREHFFQVQSIDTMKYSRDLAREKINDNVFDQEIDRQVKDIAGTGATHVAIDTPYDAEFLPYLKRWVQAARRYNLKVWFRGNFSGWERWFDYPKIDRATHIAKTKEFILNNPDLFADGDIFTSCPECENGGTGDPRQTRDVVGFRNFLKTEYQTTKDDFSMIGKKVTSNYYSMNGDVARLIMDQKTTKALDGAVTIDHYVKTPDKLVSDIQSFADTSNANVVLGEFGVPIPDINGDMSDKDQAKWINELMLKIIKMPELIAVNYWTNKGSSTQLWNDDNTARTAVGVLKTYFDPINISGSIKDEQGNDVNNVTVETNTRKVEFQDSQYVLPVLKGESINFSKNGYISLSINVSNDSAHDVQRDVVLIKLKQSFVESFIQRIIIFFNRLINGSSL